MSWDLSIHIHRDLSAEEADALVNKATKVLVEAGLTNIRFVGDMKDGGKPRIGASAATAKATLEIASVELVDCETFKR